MLSSSLIQTETLLNSLSSSTFKENVSKAPRKVSDCQTNISSSFSSSSSFFISNLDECYLELNSQSLSELTLFQIFSSQSLLPISYERKPQSKEANFYFNSRIKILQWIAEVLHSTSLSSEHRNSIYYRFSYTYLIITGKLKEQGLFYSKIEFKILVVALFFLCYKLEGFTVNKLMISTMISSFLKSVNISENELNKMIRQMEVKICELIDYDIFSIENNIYKITQLLFHIVSSSLLQDNEDVYEYILFMIDQANYEIENMNDVRLLFDLYPIERGVISFLSSVMVVLPDKIECCIEYLLNELNILHISKQQLIQYCAICVQQINNNN